MSRPVVGPVSSRQHEDLSWAVRGACRTRDGDLFYPEHASEDRDVQVELAKAVCAGCMVRTPCLAYALRHHEPGVWGGYTSAERRWLLRKHHRRVPRAA